MENIQNISENKELLKKIGVIIHLPDIEHCANLIAQELPTEKLKAIKLLKDLYGVSLREAKFIIDVAYNPNEKESTDICRL